MKSKLFSILLSAVPIVGAANGAEERGTRLQCSTSVSCSPVQSRFRYLNDKSSRQGNSCSILRTIELFLNNTLREYVLTRLLQCARLIDKFGELVRYPSDDNYLFWDTKQQEAHPECRFQPLTAQDVAFAVDVVVEEGCRFAVKGGGHAREKDDSNSAGGVTIDLQKMRSVEIFDDKNKVRLGAGHTLISAYKKLENEGLTFIGGRAASVGIGGFTLGGGYSNLSPKYGLAMDNVFEYEVCFNRQPNEETTYQVTNRSC